MGKKTVQDLLIERLDRFEAKLDEVTTKSMPNLLVEVARITTNMRDEAITEAKVQNTQTRIWGGIAGGITLIVSIASLAIAFFKR